MKKKSTEQTKISRRELLGGAAAVAAFTIVPRHVLAASGTTAPSDKLNIGKIGCGGMQGGFDITSIRTAGETFYALCDVDERQAGSAFLDYPNAKLYKDFRKMFDKEAKNLNAVSVTIPDFMHATAAIWAMERGIGAYVQKPLTQTVWEARLLKKAQQKYPKVATQMGNQGYASVATRLATETIWRGDLGDITEVHSSNGSGFARGITSWPEVQPIPPELDWNLWQGRAPEHTFGNGILPSQWRGFLDYGTMMIGDWGIHQLGPANWSLGLSYTYPTSVTCIDVSGVNPVTYPSYAFVVEFPERQHPYKKDQKMPPVKVYWYEGTFARNQRFTIPEGLTAQDFSSFNEIIIGTKGYMGTTGRGEGVSLIPRSKNEGFVAPEEMIPRSPGHFEDWIRACKGGTPSCSNFLISAPYAEWMLLGAISWRFPNEKLLWDGANLRFTNNEKANEFVKPYMRKGWELKDITV
jgi:predicted dehydrogenase